MKKIIYLCALIIIYYNVNAQLINNDPPLDTCFYMEKNLLFTYNDTQIPIADGWIYNSHYSDEFNGSVLDNQKWQCWNYKYHPDNTEVGYLAENVSLSDGNLVLSAKYDDVPKTYTSFEGYPPLSLHFSSGFIIALDTIRYGYYEIECYLPKNHHFRPCFWTFGGWATEYDEIDVFEFVKDNGSPYTILQNEYSNIDRPGTSLTKQTLLCSDSITGKTSRFGVEVLPYELVFYINGHVSSRLIYNRDYANDYNIFTCTDITRTIHMKIALSFSFDPINGAMPQPEEDVTVNYFHCYKLNRGSINTYSPAVFTPSAESSKVYPNVILGGDGHTASISTSTAVWAEKSIIFDTGFELAGGVSFSARIINHGCENPVDSPLYISNCPQ